jgi:hypothetical protein
MHLNTQIDDTLWQEALRVSGQKTPQTLLAEALREYIQRHRMQAKPLADETVEAGAVRKIMEYQS